jgi:hypothetical protein
MSLPAETVDQQRDLPYGTECEPSDRLLSVAEIQEAFRHLRPPRTRPGTTPARALAHTETSADQVPRWLNTAPDAAPGPDVRWPDTAERAGEIPQLGPFGSDWIVVVAAHAGAGASTVALAITGALSTASRPARLIETSQPSRSGLVAAASAELGTDPTGAWRHGSRHTATLYRRATDMTPNGWPALMPDTALDAGPDAARVRTVVDLGLPSSDTLAQLTEDRPRIVVVCRASLPGLRLTEHLLEQIGPLPVVIAVIGSSRWPGALTASLGPRLRTKRDTGRVVTVPAERHLQVSGLTDRPLPKSVAASARALLVLLEDTLAPVDHTVVHTAIHTGSNPTSTRSTTDERTDR